MNWDDMRIFLSVAREESLSGAAKSLRLDPATVGRRIARLERDVDAVLFVGAEGIRKLSQPAQAFLREVPTIVLDYPTATCEIP